MARQDDIGGVSALVRHTAGMAELAIDAGHPERKHMENLPYPDREFSEPVDLRFQRADKFTVAHVYDRSGQTFVPNVPVFVISIVAERTHTGFSEFLNPYLYCVTTTHGPFEWTIYKRYRHFHDLHKALVQFLEAETKRSISDLEKAQDDSDDIPSFPTRNDRIAFINDRIIGDRCRILQEYLNKALMHPKFRHHPATREFFGVSSISFVYGISVSIKEGYLLKRSNDDFRGHNIFLRFPFVCDFFKFHHGRKWFIIKDTYMTYLRMETNEVRFPMLVDKGFHITTGFRRAGTHHGIKVKNLQRSLVLKCRTKRDCEEWVQHLLNLKEQCKDDFNATSIRFNSFAPIRRKQYAQWFVNGKSYMDSVAKALLTAKEEVFITDWWLSPEIMLIRPTDDETYRLDNLLGIIADNGVRVFVLVFKEVSFAMGLNSLHTKRALIGKSKRGFIKVIRHPDHYPRGGVFLWSHHEKLVIIDQKVAFVGGIDLCFGRWDDDFMRLVDLGEENDTTLKMPSEIAATQQSFSTIQTLAQPELLRTRVALGTEEASSKKTNRMESIPSTDTRAKDDKNSTENLEVTGSKVHFTSGAKKWVEKKLSTSETENSVSSTENDMNGYNDGTSTEHETDRKSHRANRKPLMKTLTTVDSKLTDTTDDQEEEIKKTSLWRHPMMNLQNLRSLESSDPLQNDQYAHNNANQKASPNNRLRSQNAFNRLLQQAKDFTHHDNQLNEGQLYSEGEDTARPHQKEVKRWRRIAQMMRRDNDEENSEDEEKPEEPEAHERLPKIDRKHRYFVGKDYSNPYEKDFVELEKYGEDYINRKIVPRMPWHDEALVVFGKAARDVARHFIQRWNVHKCEKFLYDDSYPFLLPKTYDDREELRVEDWEKFLESSPYRVDAQCVRSCGPWSIGTSTSESSIQNAYLQMIEAAKYYIYIENQFFITIHQDSVVHNQLADALFRRIRRAHANREKFRVYVVLPLLPGFDNVNAVQAVLYFIMRSITKGDGSLFKRLESEGVPPHDYISFYGMRNHDILMGVLVTEIIYVHSKLMIIDDRMAICGSANINDRSLLGHRDSEFGIVINDLDEEDGQINNAVVKVGKFCSSWRKKLFGMLLGLQPNDPNLIDPVSDAFYDYFRDVARKNTLIYEEVFSSLPTDRIQRFDQISSYSTRPKLKDTNPIQAHEKLKSIQGFVVDYPLYFLDQENYLPSLRTPEGLVPYVMWT